MISNICSTVEQQLLKYVKKIDKVYFDIPTPKKDVPIQKTTNIDDIWNDIVKFNYLQRENPEFVLIVDGDLSILNKHVAFVDYRMIFSTVAEFEPPIDILYEEDCMIVQMELPGYDGINTYFEEDIDLPENEDVSYLSIKATKNLTYFENKKSVVYSEEMKKNTKSIFERKRKENFHRKIIILSRYERYVEVSDKTQGVIQFVLKKQKILKTKNPNNLENEVKIEELK